MKTLKMITLSEVGIFLFLFVLAKPVWDILYDAYGIITPNILVGIPLAIAACAIVNNHKLSIEEAEHKEQLKIEEEKAKEPPFAL